MQKTRINRQITAPEIRLLNDAGEQLGIFSLTQAMALAEEHGLDLVEVSPNAQPPVVKLISFDKFKYQQKKLEQQQKKRVKKVEVKTVRLSAKIAAHDIATKAKHADEFLQDGDWVKLELRMRGREQAFLDVAHGQIETFKAALTAPYRIEVPAKKAGNTISMTIAPTK
ncbi:MAG TPA: translation initiation factor IF-3 [Candidatus Doudnabacteria bacterium]|nr:translation initiation factor IF-3 [Candidatus Doudnabacteria bacterium]